MFVFICFVTLQFEESNLSIEFFWLNTLEKSITLISLNTLEERKSR